MRFAEDVLSPVAARISVAIELGAPEKSIEDLLPGPAAMALRHFSDSANRSTGAAHPLDAEKWDTFVILVHRAGISLAPDTLQRVLVEDEHWDDDQARELAIQYERAAAPAQTVMTWVEALLALAGLDVLRCPVCGGRVVQRPLPAGTRPPPIPHDTS